MEETEEIKIDEIKSKIKKVETQLKLLDDDTIEPISYPKVSQDYTALRNNAEKGEKNLQKLTILKDEIKLIIQKEGFIFPMN